MGFANGKIPSNLLVPIKTTPGGHVIIVNSWCDFMAMNEAFKKVFGYNIPLNDAYRSFDRQMTYWLRYGQNPMRAARPGTSNHGWGKALDINVGGQQSAIRLWLYRNGVKYGWVQPAYYASLTNSPEPWHWEHLSDQIVSARGREIYKEMQEDIVASIDDLRNVVREVVKAEAGPAVWLTPLAPIDNGKNAVDVVGDIHWNSRREQVASAVLETGFADTNGVNAGLAVRTGFMDPRIDETLRLLQDVANRLAALEEKVAA